MPTPLNIVNNKGRQYLKNHPSTENYHIKTVGQFFTYLKDSILLLFNTNHKFTHLGNKSIPEFNLKHIKEDLATFLKNPYLNKSQYKDKEGFLAYELQYLPTHAGILPNFYDIYRSGSLEPNELISQLINYYGNKLMKEELNDKEQWDKTSIRETLSDIETYLLGENTQPTIELRNKISTIINA